MDELINAIRSAESAANSEDRIVIAILEARREECVKLLKTIRSLSLAAKILGYEAPRREYVTGLENEILTRRARLIK